MQAMMNMMVSDMSQEMGGSMHPSVRDKIEELSRSVSQVYKYELLTTNQYLKQMELVLEIFNELSAVLD